MAVEISDVSNLFKALREQTRKERRSLLSVSVAGIAVDITGLVPAKIPAFGFGIELTPHNQQVLLYFAAFVVGYFLMMFAIYAYPDFSEWRHVHYETATSQGRPLANASFLGIVSLSRAFF